MRVALNDINEDTRMTTRGLKVDYYKSTPRYQTVASKVKQRARSMKTPRRRVAKPSQPRIKGTHHMTRRSEIIARAVSPTPVLPVAVRETPRLDKLPFEIQRQIFAVLLDERNARRRSLSGFSDDFWTDQIQYTLKFETALLRVNDAIYQAARTVLYHNNLLILVSLNHADRLWLWFAKSLRYVRFNVVENDETLPPCPVRIKHSLDPTFPGVDDAARTEIVVAAAGFKKLCKDLAECNEYASRSINEDFALEALPPLEERSRDYLLQHIWLPLTFIRYNTMTVTDRTGVFEKSDGTPIVEVDDDYDIKLWAPDDNSVYPQKPKADQDKKLKADREKKREADQEKKRKADQEKKRKADKDENEDADDSEEEEDEEDDDNSEDNDDDSEEDNSSPPSPSSDSDRSDTSSEAYYRIFPNLDDRTDIYGNEFDVWAYDELGENAKEKDTSGLGWC